MAANVCNGLSFLLLSQLLCFRLLFLLLLQFKPFRRCFELGLIDDKEVARAALGEVRLGQYVLHTSDGTDLALFIDVFQLMHLVGFVDDTITFLKMDQLVRLLTVVKDVT